jgi:predicted anti-sigma-YlaC factor YlaD
MHCTIEDLVAVRDGEGSVWARRHLEECDECRAERERLYQRVAQLKALPSVRPSRDRWPEIRNTVRAERGRVRRRWLRGGLAIAATLVGLMIIRSLFVTQVYADDLAQAKQESAQLETTLRDYDPEARVMSGREAQLSARLEDQIATLDGRLAQLNDRSGEAQLVDLWRQRVDLMQQLVQVHVTRAKYVGL